MPTFKVTISRKALRAFKKALRETDLEKEQIDTDEKVFREFFYQYLDYTEHDFRYKVKIEGVNDV